MSWFGGMRARLRGLLLSARFEREMDEEFRFHLEMEVEKNLRAGMDPGEARRQALVAFGGTDRHREALREGRAAHHLSELGRDLAYGWRSLRRSPSFALVGISAVALGVGASTSVFTMVNAFLLRPLAVERPGELVSVQEARTGSMSSGIHGMRMPWERYLAWREEAADFLPQLLAMSDQRVSLRVGDETLPGWSALTAGPFFQSLGVQPVLGAPPLSDTDPAVILGHHLWMSRFGADPDVLGRTIRVDGHTYTVAGVAPAEFKGLVHGLRVDLWIPYEAYHSPRGLPAGHAGWVNVIGRLGDGVDPAEAGVRADAVARRLPPDPGSEIDGARLDPLAGIPVGEARTLASAFLGMLQGMALLVLAIASANLAAMFMARGVVRRRELAVRASLGAGRGRIVRQLLAETFLVFVVGGALGLVLASQGARLLSALPMPLSEPVALDFRIEPAVVAFALGVTLITALASGLWPALGASRTGLLDALRSGLPGSGTPRDRARSLFVGGQLALSVLLLVVAGLFGRSLQAGLTVDPGIQTARVLTADLRFPPGGHSPEEANALFRTIVERVQTLPGVESAALARTVPLSMNLDRANVVAPAPGDGGEGSLSAGQNLVTSDFFRVVAADLVAGRPFQDIDTRDAPAVGIVTEGLARRIWPGMSPLGRTLRLGDVDLEVVGVVADARYVSLRQDPIPFLFRPLHQAGREHAGLLVRLREGDARGPAAARIMEAIRNEVRAVDPDLAVQGAALSDLAETALFPQVIAAILVGIFGLVGLLLAVVGVYGVLAFHVARRTREFGVRIALGARQADVLRLVLGRGALLAGAGGVVGLVLAAVLTTVIQSFIPGVSALDPVVFLGVPLLLGTVALVASWFPARRALRADPLVAMREE